MIIAAMIITAGLSASGCNPDAVSGPYDAPARR
jgi:hypothetical protein